MTGYVKNHRKIQNWRFYKRPDYAHVWQHLIRLAHHDDKHCFDGYGNKICKGQFTSGYTRLANETGVNRSKIVRIVQHLKNDTMIETQNCLKCSLFTIVKWDEYQSRNDDQNASETQVKRKRNQNKNGKNGKNGKNINNSDFDFDKIYKIYPVSKGKKRGLEKCAATIKTQDQYDNLLKATKEYSRECESKDTDSKYIKHFSTFMNCWEDYLDAANDYEAKKKKIDAIFNHTETDQEPSFVSNLKQ